METKDKSSMRIGKLITEIKEAVLRLTRILSLKWKAIRQTGTTLQTDIRDREKWKEVQGGLKRAGEEISRAAKVAISPGKKKE